MEAKYYRHAQSGEIYAIESETGNLAGPLHYSEATPEALAVGFDFEPDTAWISTQGWHPYATVEQYRIATVDGGTGYWEFLDTFEASDDKSANAYAEANYPDLEWYVLNSQEVNING